MVAALIALIVVLAGPVLADETPYLGDPVDEGATTEVGWLFRDTKGGGTTPRDAWYWVDDVTTHERLLGPVQITPGPSVAIKMAPQANRIVDDSKALEDHSITLGYRFPAGCVPVPTPNSNCEYANPQRVYRVRNNRVVVGQSTPGTFGPTPAPTPTP